MTDAALAAALRAHWRRNAWLRDDDLDFARLEPVARTLAGGADEASRAEADATLRASPEAAEVVMRVAAMVAHGELVALGSDERGAWRSGRRWGVVAAAVLAAAAAVALALAPGREPLPASSEPEHSARLVAKGGDDHLYVAARRGDHVFRVASGERLEMGDVVGLFYSAASAGHLRVWHLDDALRPTPLYPIMGASDEIIAGVEVPLPNNAVMDPGSGCAWFVAAFSDHSIGAAAIEQALRTVRLERQRCELAVDMAGSRSLRVLSVTR